MATEAPLRHHIDRRAPALAAAGVGLDHDELLTTRETADWLGVSTQWLEIGRSKNYGPKYARISARLIRYRRSDLLTWLEERVCANNAAYTQSKAA